jgi:hypothetical protein
MQEMNEYHSHTVFHGRSFGYGFSYEYGERWLFRDFRSVNSHGPRYTGLYEFAKRLRHAKLRKDD